MSHFSELDGEVRQMQEGSCAWGAPLNLMSTRDLCVLFEIILDEALTANPDRDEQLETLRKIRRELKTRKGR